MRTSIFENKTVLITGGTGSLGQTLIHHILADTGVRKLIIFSRDELKQSHMHGVFKDERMRYFLGDVRDLPRLQRAFRGVDIVIHTAALKQVPTLEYNPNEAVKTNVIGSQNVIDAAIDQKVKKVLLVSTDKAVQPVNLYGATKLCAEKLFVHGNAYSPGETLFSCVRYGNVLGSRGSLIDILLRNKTNKVTVTHNDMTRFWITLEQAVQLVFHALEHMNGGEIFVPKIPSMKIVDIIDVMMPDAEREIIGIRAGEKMHEILLTAAEARHTVDNGDYFVIMPHASYATTEDQQSGEAPKFLADDFEYTSDKNERWLGANEILDLIKRTSKQ